MFEGIFSKKKKSNMTEALDVMDRRAFLRNSLAAAGTVAIGAVAAKSIYEHDTGTHPAVSPEVSQEIEIDPPTENIETFPYVNGSEKFEKMAAGYAVWWTMPRTSIAFFDKDNAPVGEPVPFQDFEADKIVTKNGKEIQVKYLYTPVKKDESGAYSIGSIAPEWSDYVEERFAAEHGMTTDELTRTNVAQDFISAFSQTDEPELQKGIRSGEITTNLDIVHYFGDKPVRGAEKFSRIEYVRQHLEFHHPRMSDTVKSELRQLLPALCAKESKFNDDLVSDAGARGISQFMPSTWNGLKLGEYGERQPLATQVVAMGKHCDNIYSEFMTHEVEEALDLHIEPLFPSREAFERDFLVPCMINAYNPGAGTLRTALREFLKVTDTSDFIEKYHTNIGKDVFFAMNRFALESDTGLLAEYKERSAEYVSYIYALRDILDTTSNGSPLRVAAN